MKTLKQTCKHGSPEAYAMVGYLLSRMIDCDVRHGPAGIDIWIAEKYASVFNPHLTTTGQPGK